MTHKNAQELAKGLRELADFVESKGVGISSGYQFTEYEVMINWFATHYGDEEKTRKNLRNAARAMAPCEKVYSGSYFDLRKKFGQYVTLEITADRTAVCERVEVGTEVVPARPAEPEKIVPKYEWVCNDTAILGG